MVRMRHLRRSQPAQPVVQQAASVPVPALGPVAARTPAPIQPPLQTPSQAPADPIALAPLRSTNRLRIPTELPGLGSALAGGPSVVAGVKRRAPGNLDLADVEVIDLTGD
ncbi:hypothetical protein JDV02_004223 [Purpureocillium takamizusanense]|uniref:Uncharacterized protein n=1 Tax=Purpureocillium takamizusanense TaxID=2060973 RepID=A0A9Q8VAK4_9HYPO|nr:uncharacterized protein JDV02_004223 [Purpureocillium takamizusanense]UNI17916.1 hypothetical protein JDV02_004223 [Purpureocillium takamizusanense]